jgi:hypothetical protein
MAGASLHSFTATAVNTNRACGVMEAWQHRHALEFTTMFKQSLIAAVIAVSTVGAFAQAAAPAEAPATAATAAPAAKPTHMAKKKHVVAKKKHMKAKKAAAAPAA